MRVLIKLLPALVILVQFFALDVMAALRTTNLPSTTSVYRLKSVIPVEGRQGIACDGNFIYISGTSALYKYDMDGNLLKRNETPFDSYPGQVNHIGDIDVYNDDLYVSAENFNEGTGQNILIAIHDSETLKLKRTYSFQSDSGQTEISGITVDPIKKTLWLCSWDFGESGSYLYEYDIKGKYLRKVHLQPVPQNIQGVYWVNGDLFITADDGIADDNDPDHIYRVKLSSYGSASVVLEKTLDEAIRHGEVDGLCIDPKSGDLLVLINRGTRIVHGAPKGFYPGYEQEISEIYRYAILPMD